VRTRLLAISWAEFLTLYVNDVIGRNAIRVELIEKFDKDFKSMDTDNDGKLAGDELIEILKNNNSVANIENTLAFYRDFDYDKDGKYSWDEFFVCYVRLFE